MSLAIGFSAAVSRAPVVAIPSSTWCCLPTLRQVLGFGQVSLYLTRIEERLVIASEKLGRTATLSSAGMMDIVVIHS
jgi:hypothetical protein